MSPRGARRRLAKVEDRLAPSGVVLRWLAEVKAHGSLAAYADALAQEPGGLDLLGRFLELLEPAVERMTSAGSVHAGHLARRRATRRALFRLFLVIRLNLHAARRAPLRTVTALATSYQLDALLAGQPDEQRRSDDEPDSNAGWRTWRDRGEALLTELYADRWARVSLEERFLERVGSLTPEAEVDYATATDLTVATLKEGLAAQTTPTRQPLAEFQEVGLPRLVNAALEQAGDLAGAIIAGALSDLGEIDRAAQSIPWPTLGLSPPPAIGPGL